MPKKILLADDSITIQKVVELTFSDGDYEVTAVNNGAKAVQKLAEMRPDIILSDIIMPEKNGYEVCEFVKSHPEYRNIPIILLTGTFEPFDPDRAEKAGCDAVVTKPFESQSLIHKVEELIAQASPAGAAPTEAPTDQTWATGPAEPAQAETPAAWGEPAAPPFGFNESGSPSSDVFAGGDNAAPTVEVPYNSPQASSPFLREEEPAAPAEAASSPWDDAPAYSGETRTFPKMSFDDFDKVATSAPPPPEPEPEPQQDLEAPFGAPPPAEEFSGETRAFTKLSFDDLQRMATTSAPPPEPVAAPEPPAPPPLPEPQPESAPWSEEPAAPAAAAWDAPAEQSAPWDDQQAYAGETRTFERVSFDDLQRMAAEQQPAAEAPAWQPPVEEPAWQAPAEEPAWESSAAEPAAEEPAWNASPEPSWPEPPPVETPAFGTGGFTEETPTPAVQSAAATAEALPWSEPSEPAWQEEAAEPAEPPSYPAEVPFQAPAEPSGPFAGDHAEASAAEESAVPAAAWAAPQEPAAAVAGDRPFELTDEMVDRIARRVVELMSDQVIRSIAWEVIPDAAEIAVKNRIRQLEAEEV